MSNSHAKSVKWNFMGQLSNLLVVSLLLLVIVLLFSNSEQRYSDYVSAQNHLMEKSAADTVRSVTLNSSC